MKTLQLVTLFALSMSTLAMAATPVVEKEGFVRDPEGRSLYTFSLDTPGQSNCNDACNKSWQPLMAKQDAAANGQLTLVTRNGGGTQWAYQGHALYYFIGDRNVGDMNGDGVGGKWHVARTANSTATPASPAPAAAATYQY